MSALAREFTETVKVRAGCDPAFRAALLAEAVDLLISGNVDTGKAVLRTCVNATVGFEKLAAETGHLQKETGVRLAVGVDS
ncbi:hypothetical protein GGD81_001991 [Rhodobium orientis]|uniref:Uncharacterized protein n=1 Tax=Rhodobium orientis TaxID=34017 RepID=A0A327JUP4_9HYPH|nr:hypothetical protein [Rhodobium orientis]MBB4302953.1 hypothetical protein [Rhodobium orientis]MBK5949514.1 hypothetical protein [Rhodobium orientis]RAI29305.1 hypothetical protein CH339_03195 [Rhodobium orientis]